MLNVETYLDFSPGKGIGLYSSEFIPKGAVYWVRNEIFDKIISKQEVDELDPLASLYVKKYGFLEKSGNWYLCGDNSRFSNHSRNSNTQNIFNSEGLLTHSIALNDIQIGEEILIDYTEICLACIDNLDFEEK